jgi:hypothetical protein
MFALVKFFQACLVFSTKAGSCPSGATCSARFEATFLTLFVNIRLGTKWLAKTNTLAYLSGASVMKEKEFALVVPEVSMCLNFFFVTDALAK